MKMFLLSDNIDTQMGLRLVGIEGVVIHTKEELHNQLNRLSNDAEIGIVLITTVALNLDSKEIYRRKIEEPRPLIVEIPDRHDSVDIGEVINSYISEAIGLKI